MLIDKLLYFIFPRRVHEWAHNNRAKVRAYALGAAAPLLVALTEQYAPDNLRGAILSALFSTGAYTVGRQTHKVVTPWEADA